ncbi:MAG: hypothetical protein J7K26_01455 [Candidatus Aenigmarchaeota archaeon]|nr:hypothetical protein [Candidatus Aenigmarchaeota archaeon]
MDEYSKIAELRGIRARRIHKIFEKRRKEHARRLADYNPQVYKPDNWGVKPINEPAFEAHRQKRETYKL